MVYLWLLNHRIVSSFSGLYPNSSKLCITFTRSFMVKNTNVKKTCTILRSNAMVLCRSQSKVDAHLNSDLSHIFEKMHVPNNRTYIGWNYQPLRSSRAFPFVLSLRTDLDFAKISHLIMFSNG